MLVLCVFSLSWGKHLLKANRLFHTPCPLVVSHCNIHPGNILYPVTTGHVSAHMPCVQAHICLTSPANFIRITCLRNVRRIWQIIFSYVKKKKCRNQKTDQPIRDWHHLPCQWRTEMYCLFSNALSCMICKASGPHGSHNIPVTSYIQN